MSKYIVLQDGGDATGAEMFNQYIDQLIASQQNDDIDYTNNISTPEDENEFIKNLEEYDEERTKQEETEKRNSEYNALNQHFNNLLDKFDDLQQQMMFYGSQEGQDYFEQVYDTNNTTYLPFGTITPSNKPTVGYQNTGGSLDESTLRYKQMMAESSGNPNAIGPETRYGTAKGAFQFIDATWDRYKPHANASQFNIKDATIARDKYVGDLLRRYKGNQRLAMAAYNWGEGRVDRALKKYGSEWERYIPKETKGYLRKIFK